MIENIDVFLPETWLLPDEQDLINNASKAFTSYSTSSVDLGNGVISGMTCCGIGNIHYMY